MTEQQCERISRERCREWTEEMIRNHATPAIMIGIGHGQSVGELHVCVPELSAADSPLTYRDMALILRRVADQMENER